MKNKKVLKLNGRKWRVTDIHGDPATTGRVITLAAKPQSKLQRAVALVLALCAAFALGGLCTRMALDPPPDARETAQTAASVATTAAHGEAYQAVCEIVTDLAPQQVAYADAVEPAQTAEDASEYIYYDVPLSDELQEYAQDVCVEYDFPHFDIIVALIERESSFREDVVSATDDYGLMQINTINHEWLRDELGISDFLDARQNIRGGIHILAEHYHTYGNIELALMAYNLGAAGAARLWEQGVYGTDYSRWIMERAAELTERTITR